MRDKIYVQMFSVHGLLRYENPELGRDADTGGQIKYVLEMAEELSKREEVKMVDLFTRLISDKRVSSDYSRPVEKISDKFRIIRIRCGGQKYIRKEMFWPYLDEFIDKTIKFIKQEAVYPDIIHAHYADAGYIGIQLSEYFSTPFVFTGHSLGRPKKGKLIDEGMGKDEINKKYRMENRIFNEEEIIKHADLVVASTYQEVKMQYGMYTNKNLAKYSVIPPGINLDKFYSFYHDMVPGIKKEEEYIQAHATILEKLNCFFIHPEKPLILALCRADKRKNISGLIDSYGKDKELQAMANLAIFAGIRKNISEMEENEKDVLTQILLLMDKYDLYGKMAIPKRHNFSHEVPELYRIAAEKNGVFVNVALTEPFGLTLIEAAACGLPVVATNDGGPRDIISNCKNGILVDPSDNSAISAAIKSIIIDKEKWKDFSSKGIKGVKNHYGWKAHVEKYAEEVAPFLGIKGEVGYKKAVGNPVGDRLTRLKYFIISDIDNTLIGNDEAFYAFAKMLKENEGTICFGVATGRPIDSVMALIKRYDVIFPDIIISSVGSEMYYRGGTFADRGWQTHISKSWYREKIKFILDKLDFLTYQEDENQGNYKISYYMEDQKDRVAQLHDVLVKNKCHYNLIYSHGKFLDILPHRASKGKAIKYFSYKWGIDLDRIMVCGDSGNDEEMLRGNTLGVVVGNYTKELEKLKKKTKIYFSKYKYAEGIIDGIHKYNFIERSKI